MQDDERCCGTGTCLIDAQGRCWCGQQWDGVAMCLPGKAGPAALKPLDLVEPQTSDAFDRL